MANFLQDGKNNNSHKRLINISACACAMLLTLGLPIFVVYKGGEDLGTNMVFLILGIWAIATGSAIGTNIVDGHFARDDHKAQYRHREQKEKELNQPALFHVGQSSRAILCARDSEACELVMAS